MTDIRLSALDLGTNTGLCYGVPGRSPNFATWRMPPGDGASIGELTNVFSDCLAGHIANFRPTVIVFEAPYLGEKLAKNMNTARRLLWWPGEVERQAHKHQIECAEVYITTARKSFTGSGAAKKLDVQNTCRQRGFRIKTEHEGDAAAIWYHALLEIAPDLAEAYDPLFKANLPPVES